MWCLDDIGRDSLDWVGPPAWEKACFNSPEWGGSSSPVKNGASPDCIIVAVVVEWLYSFRRIIIDKRADLSDFFPLILVGKMCVFVSRPVKIVTFLRKDGDLPKRVVDFHRERDTFRQEIIEIVEDFDEKVTTTTANPGNR